MAILSAGLDLAKNVFAMHGIDEPGKPLQFKRSVRRRVKSHGQRPAPSPVR